MNGISVNIVVMLLRGLPECLLVVLAFHFFTATKIQLKKYLLISVIYTLATYLVRFLPIALGVHSVITLFIIIITFQLVYKTQLSKMIRTITVAAVILILLATSVVLNMLLLIVIYGRNQAEALFTSSDGLTQSAYTFPSVVFFAVFVLIGHVIIKKLDARNEKDGETGKKTGE